MSKGSWYRPHDKEKFDAGWDRIFSKEDKEKEAEERCIDYRDYEEYAEDMDTDQNEGC
jgi:hypothetical protein